MYCQMIRVISSPSSSTTGLATLILAMKGPFGARAGKTGGRRDAGGGRHKICGGGGESGWGPARVAQNYGETKPFLTPRGSTPYLRKPPPPAPRFCSWRQTT